jgi:hypothetical protein
MTPWKKCTKTLLCSFAQQKSMVLAEALLFSFILLQAKKRRESSSMIPLPFLVDNRVLVLRQELQSLKKSRQAQLTAYADDLRQQTLQYAAVRQDFLQAAGTGNHVSVYKQALREVCTTEVITNAILRKLAMLLFLSHHLEVLKQNTTFLEMQTTEIQQYLENQKLQLMNQQTDMERAYREKIKKLEQETYLLQQEYENKQAAGTRDSVDQAAPRPNPQCGFGTSYCHAG